MKNINIRDNKQWVNRKRIFMWISRELFTIISWKKALKINTEAIKLCIEKCQHVEKC